MLSQTGSLQQCHHHPGRRREDKCMLCTLTSARLMTLSLTTSFQCSFGHVGLMNGQWGRWRTGQLSKLRGLWSAPPSPVGGLYLMVPYVPQPKRAQSMYLCVSSCSYSLSSLGEYFRLLLLEIHQLYHFHIITVSISQSAWSGRRWATRKKVGFILVLVA